MTSPTRLPGGVLLREATVDDAPALLDAYRAARDHLARYEPERPDSFWTLDGQRERLATFAEQHGRTVAAVLIRDRSVLGLTTLTGITRGPFCHATVGYWVVPAATGQGLATATVAAWCRLADTELGLHRLGASTALDNVASQRVLEKNGFVRIGTAPGYIHLRGEWQDSHLYQRILHNRPPVS